MKESMRKPVLFFMDLMVVFLTVILTIELIAIAGFTFPVYGNPVTEHPRF